MEVYTENNEFIESAQKILELYNNINFKGVFDVIIKNSDISVTNRWLGLPVIFTIKLTTDGMSCYQGEATCKIRGNGTVITKSIHNIKDYNEFISRFYKAVVDVRCDNTNYIESRQFVAELFDSIYEKIHDLQIKD